MWFQTRTKASSRDATNMSHTHEGIETKYNELVYKGSKSHGLSLLQSTQAQEIFTCQQQCKEIKKDKFAFNQVKGQSRYIHKNLQKEFTSQGKS